MNLNSGTLLVRSAAVLGLLLGGCTSSRSQTNITDDHVSTGVVTQEEPTRADPAPESETEEAAASQPSEQGHHAPIDCPLAAAGHDPGSMRPFEEVEAYIAFLDRPDRAEWQQPEAVITALNLADDEVVVDLGAGSGYFAFRFAEHLPGGEVEALDIEPEMVRHIHHTTMTEDIDNLHAGFVDPALPEYRDDATLVFVCDVLHHVPDQQAWLNQVAAELPEGARFAIVEFREGDLPQGPPEGTKIPHDTLIEMASAAGMTLVEDLDDLLPYQYMLVFQATE